MDAALVELQSQLERYLSERLQSPATVQNLRSLSGGACQDNYLIDVDIQGGPEAGSHRLVLRTDKGAALLASLSRADEYRVAEAAFDAGVKTPRPYWLETTREAIGRPFYFMQRIGGRATGRYVVKDRELAKVRPQLAADLAANLARLHSITPQNASANLKQSLGEGPAPRGNSIALDACSIMRQSLDGLPDAYPSLELALNWMESRAPGTEQPALVHGDFRTGNFMISPDGLQGIVDWEFAHWGDRHEDISWLCLRDWRFGKNNKEVGGFADRDEFYRAYQQSSGIAVDPERVRFWEIMGNLRWAVGSAQQAERHLSGKDRGIELAAIGRRTGEMEYEILRLIENAESS
ncbi:MAG: phosphotransferase family protein [Leptospirales bacterium]|nr:phosphotransferase family protein [Leptospirales bacterium]